MHPGLEWLLRCGCHTNLLCFCACCVTGHISRINGDQRGPLLMTGGPYADDGAHFSVVHGPHRGTGSAGVL